MTERITRLSASAVRATAAAFRSTRLLEFRTDGTHSHARTVGMGRSEGGNLVTLLEHITVLLASPQCGV